jgi:oligopeptide/dipeptide ABC transporter ATP-binding protein
MRVGDQIAELFMVHRGMGKAAAWREAVRLLDLVRIPNAAARAADYPHSFSGGMKQRVIIAGAVALSPEVLIADEPTTALDVTVQAEILSLIDDLRNAYGMGVLLITHDLGVVYQVADRVLVMYAGRIVETGDVETVCTAPSHPYTAGLLASVPDLSHPGAATAAIPGNPPKPGDDRGCSFAPRCTRAQPVCSTQLPLLEPAARSVAACHFPIGTESSHGRATSVR